MSRAWLEALGGRGDLTLVRHDVRDPLPDDMPRFRLRRPRGGHRLADVLPRASARDDGRQHQRPAPAARVRVAASSGRLDFGGFLFFSSSEIYGDPPADRIPTPEDYRGNVSCTGPRACYDESKRYGETLCVVFAQHYGVPVRMARPFNNYGPGLKISDRRVIPDFARDVIERIATSSCCPTAPRSGRSATSRMRSPATTRRSCEADAGEPYNIGDRPARDLDGRARRAARRDGARAVRLRRRASSLGEPTESDYLVDNPNRRCPDIDKVAHGAGLRAVDPDRRGPAAIARLVPLPPRGVDA